MTKNANPKTCYGPECTRDAATSGLCRAHNNQYKKRGSDPSLMTPLGTRREPRGCKVEKCEDKHMAQGYCSSHYSYFVASNAKERCRHMFCTRPVRHIGYCLSHYKQNYRWGFTWDIGTPRPGGIQANKECSIDDCDRTFYADGMCHFHYSRDRAGKKVDDPYRNGKDFWDTCPISDCKNKVSHKFYLCQPHRERAKWYGLTENELYSLLNNASCQVCGSTKRLAIDHDHSCCSTHKHSCGDCVKGVLCDLCNKAAGACGDDPDRLRKLADFKEQKSWRERQTS